MVITNSGGSDLSWTAAAAVGLVAQPVHPPVDVQASKDAISSPVTWFLFQPFMIYNIRRASRDPRVEMVRVEHARGRTRIVGE